MFDQCLYFNTTSLAREVERVWTRAFRPFGLTPSQGFMLRALLNGGAMSGTQLASLLNISKATCSRSVDGLVALDLVRKVQTDDDARRYSLEPTPRARALHAGLDAASAAVTRALKRTVGAEVFDLTVQQMRRIGQSIR